jgi:hypothetical protein
VTRRGLSNDCKNHLADRSRNAHVYFGGYCASSGASEIMVSIQTSPDWARIEIEVLTAHVPDLSWLGPLGQVCGSLDAAAHLRTGKMTGYWTPTAVVVSQSSAPGALFAGATRWTTPWAARIVADRGQRHATKLTYVLFCQGLFHERRRVHLSGFKGLSSWLVDNAEVMLPATF